MGWQEELPEKTEEFLKEFGINFAKFYAVSLVVKISNEAKAAAADGGDGDGLRLQYRDWGAVQRESLMGGNIYMKTGEGVNAFGAWKSFYAQETQDYNLALFGSEKDATKAGAKPKEVIRLAGYELVTNTTWHYGYEARDIAHELSCEENAPQNSDYSWALVHPVRPHYMFQMHKGKNPPCPCLGGNVVEPAGEGAEFAGDRDKWTEFFDSAIAKSGPRDLANNVISMTFERAKNAMANNFSSLNGFSDDGTEGQILADMIFLAIFMDSCKEEIQEEIRGLPDMVRITGWYKARGVGASIVEKAVEKAWAEIQKQAEGLNAKIEPKIKEALGPIFEAKETIKAKITDGVGGALGDALSKVVSPVLDKILKVLEKPLKEGFKECARVFHEEAKAVEGVTDKAERNRILDRIARDSYKTAKILDQARELVAPLKELKDATGEALEDMDIPTMRGQAEAVLLEGLDAMAYTLQQRLDAPDAGSFKEVLDSVLDDLGEVDRKRLAAKWSKQAIAGCVINAFKRATGPAIDPLIDELQGLIPEDLSEILDIRAEYDSIVDATLAEPINKCVDATFDED